MTQRPDRRQWAAGLLAAALVLNAGATVTAAVPQPPAGSVTVRGAGGEFSAPIFNYWFGRYKSAFPSANVKLTYTANGAGAGKKAMQANPPTTDYAGSPVPMSDSELAGVKNGRDILHIPHVLGAIALGIRLDCTKAQISLTGDNVGDLFSGSIRTWDDPKLRTGGRNPSLADCKTRVTVVRRSDSAGQTYVFTSYLKEETTAYWKGKTSLPTQQYSGWPVGVGVPLGSGVALKVKQTNGAIGYLELSYANQAGLKKAFVENGDGTKFVAPTPASITSAAANSTGSIPSDLRIAPVVGARGLGSYPIVSYGFWLVFKQDPVGMDHAKAQISYMYWALNSGQQYASALDYARLPTSVRTKAIAQLHKITAGGNTVWP